MQANVRLPKFGTTSKGLLNPSSLVLFGMAAFAYLGHFVAPDLYHSFVSADNDDGNNLVSSTADTSTDDGVGNSHQNHADTDTGSDNAILNSFFRVSLGGFVLTTIINCLIMAFGFLTFGGNSMGLVLNNFSTLDRGATVCRFFTTISVLGGYPFLIRACRREILGLLKLFSNRDPKPSDEPVTTTLLLVSLTVASMFLSDAGLIIGLAGAVMGSALAYIIPSILFLSATNNKNKNSTTNMEQKSRPRSMLLERLFCRFLVGFGTFAAFASIVSILGGV